MNKPYENNLMTKNHFQKYYIKKHIKIIVLKKLLYNFKTSYNINNNYSFLLKAHSRFNTITTARNYCSVTARGRSVSRTFKVEKKDIHRKPVLNYWLVFKKLFNNLIKKAQEWNWLNQIGLIRARLGFLILKSCMICKTEGEFTTLFK